MSNAATIVRVTGDERRQLERWMRTPKTEQRFVFRARIVWMPPPERAPGLPRFDGHIP